MRAAPSGRGQRRVPFDPATAAAPSGPALTRLRCQRPAGKRHNVVDGERARALLVQLAHQLPRPSTASGAASAASLALIGSVTAAEAATCLHRGPACSLWSAAYGIFTSHGRPPAGSTHGFAPRFENRVLLGHFGGDSSHDARSSSELRRLWGLQCHTFMVHIIENIQYTRY